MDGRLCLTRAINVGKNDRPNRAHVDRKLLQKDREETMKRATIK